MTSGDAAAPPLGGIRVLDFTRVLSGPYLTMTLADLGADVIKVEHPRGDDTRAYLPPGRNGESANYMGLNRLKRSVVLDLSAPKERDLAIELACRSDILVENFRPGTMDRMGLGYEALSRRNERLIYCAISGYGYTSSFRDLAGYDPIIQAETGLMYLTGDETMPPIRAGGSVIDVLAGVHAGMGVLAALHARGKSGRGQFVDVALYNTALGTTSFVLQGALLSGENPPRTGNTSFFMCPNGVFKCADGEIFISAGNNKLFGKLCRALGIPGLPNEPRFATNRDRLTNLAALTEELQAVFVAQPRDHWVARLREEGVPAGSVRTPIEALASEETKAGGIVQDVEHKRAGRMPVIATPIRLSGTPVRLTGPAPVLGEHTEEVLREVLGAAYEKSG